MANETQTPPTIESLTEELAAEKQAKVALEQLHTTLQTQFDTVVASHQAYETKLATSAAALTQATSDLADATKVATEQHETITSLTEQLEKLQANPEAYSTIVVDKTTYEVQTKGFQYKKQEYTVADLIKDKALQKELVKKGVGFLVAKTA